MNACRRVRTYQWNKTQLNDIYNTDNGNGERMLDNDILWYRYVGTSPIALALAATRFSAPTVDNTRKTGQHTDNPDDRSSLRKSVVNAVADPYRSNVFLKFGYIVRKCTLDLRGFTWPRGSWTFARPVWTARFWTRCTRGSKKKRLPISLRVRRVFNGLFSCVRLPRGKKKKLNFIATCELHDVRITLNARRTRVHNFHEIKIFTDFSLDLINTSFCARYICPWCTCTGQGLEPNQTETFIFFFFNKESEPN